MIHHRSVDLDMKLPSRRAGIAAGKTNQRSAERLRRRSGIVLQ
jgi:hypothetical protein